MRLLNYVSVLTIGLIKELKIHNQQHYVKPKKKENCMKGCEIGRKPQ